MEKDIVALLCHTDLHAAWCPLGSAEWRVCSEQFPLGLLLRFVPERTRFFPFLQYFFEL